MSDLLFLKEGHFHTADTFHAFDWQKLKSQQNPVIDLKKFQLIRYVVYPKNILR